MSVLIKKVEELQMDLKQKRSELMQLSSEKATLQSELYDLRSRNELTEAALKFNEAQCKNKES